MIWEEMGRQCQMGSMVEGTLALSLDHDKCSALSGDRGVEGRGRLRHWRERDEEQGCLVCSSGNEHDLGYRDLRPRGLQRPSWEQGQPSGDGGMKKAERVDTWKAAMTLVEHETWG